MHIVFYVLKHTHCDSMHKLSCMRPYTNCLDYLDENNEKKHTHNRCIRVNLYNILHLCSIICVFVSLFVRINAKSHFLTIYHFCLVHLWSVRYRSNNAGSAWKKHYSYISRKLCRQQQQKELRARERLVKKTSGAYHEIFFIHVWMS